MAKRGELPALSEAQLEIMNIVWSLGEATVADVWTELGRERGVARNTVQTLMSRMADKGWLKSKRVGQAFQFRPAVPREEAQRGMVSSWVEKVFGGSAEGLVMALLDDRALSKEEAARIRAKIREAERRKE